MAPASVRRVTSSPSCGGYSRVQSSACACSVGKHHLQDGTEKLAVVCCSCLMEGVHLILWRVQGMARDWPTVGYLPSQSMDEVSRTSK